MRIATKDFDIENKIGEGGFSTVYKVHLNRPFGYNSCLYSLENDISTSFLIACIHKISKFEMLTLHSMILYCRVCCQMENLWQ